MVPALAVVLVTMITALLTGFSIVKEKEAGNFGAAHGDPLPPCTSCLGENRSLVVIGLRRALRGAAHRHPLVRHPVKGNFFRLILFGLVYMASSLGIGISPDRRAYAAAGAVFDVFVMFFFLLLSGFFIPIEKYAGVGEDRDAHQPAALTSCSSYAKLFLKGSGPHWSCGSKGLAMLAIGVVMFAGAAPHFSAQRCHEYSLPG